MTTPDPRIASAVSEIDLLACPCCGESKSVRFSGLNLNSGGGYRNAYCDPERGGCGMQGPSTGFDRRPGNGVVSEGDAKRAAAAAWNRRTALAAKADDGEASDALLADRIAHVLFTLPNGREMEHFTLIEGTDIRYRWSRAMAVTEIKRVIADVRSAPAPSKEHEERAQCLDSHQGEGSARPTSKYVVDPVERETRAQSLPNSSSADATSGARNDHRGVSMRLTEARSSVWPSGVGETGGEGESSAAPPVSPADETPARAGDRVDAAARNASTQPGEIAAVSPASPAPDEALEPCPHRFESNPGMFDTQHRYCALCGVAEGCEPDRRHTPPAPPATRAEYKRRTSDEQRIAIVEKISRDHINNGDVDDTRIPVYRDPINTLSDWSPSKHAFDPLTVGEVEGLLADARAAESRAAEAEKKVAEWHDEVARFNKGWERREEPYNALEDEFEQMGWAWAHVDEITKLRTENERLRSALRQARSHIPTESASLAIVDAALAARKEA